MSGAGAAGVGIGSSQAIGASGLTKYPDDVRVICSRWVMTASLLSMRVGPAVPGGGSASAEGRVVDRAEGDVHRLLVRVEVDRPVAALVAEARRLDTAERGAEV